MDDEKTAVTEDTDVDDETTDEGGTGAGRPAGDSSKAGYSSTPKPPFDGPDPSGGPGGN